MNKIEALEEIKSLWNDHEMELGEKISKISNAFYSEGLDLSSTAAYIKATPSELYSLLNLGQFDENMLELISKVDPPKTTWTMLGNANDDETAQALKALSQTETKEIINQKHYTLSEFVYNKMQEVSGPTAAQIIANLSYEEIKHIQKKAEDFDKVSKWQNTFLKGMAENKRKGNTLTVKQADTLVNILSQLSDKGVITHNSIDGDKELCNKILSALGK